MIATLLKNRFKSLIYGMFLRGRGKTLSKPAVSKIVLFSAIYIYLAFAFFFLSTVTALSLGSALIPIGASWLYFAVLTLMTASLVFVLSIFETKSEIFEGRDNELLLSMPIKPRDIVAARMITVLIYNFIEAAIISLPAAVVYCIIGGFEIRGLIGGLLMGAVAALIASVLSSGVGYLLSLLMKRIKNKTLFTVIFSLLFVFLYMFGYSKIISGFQSFIESLVNNTEAIKSDYAILYYIGKAALLEPLCIIPAVIISVALLALAYLAISKSYISIVTVSQSTKSARYVVKNTSQSSILFALFKKELTKLKSSAVYMLNSCIGLVFELVLAIAALFKRDMIIGVALSLGLEASSLAPMLICALILIGSVNMMSASALSLEGDGLWILKTLPIQPKTVLWAKTLPHIAVSAPITLLSSVLVFIASGVELYYLPFFVLTPMLSVAFTAFLGLIFNIAFPKFVYENEAQVVKQSLAVTLTLGVEMLVSVGALFLSLWLSAFNPLLSSGVIFLALLIATAALYTVLFSVSLKRYEKIEV